MYWILNQSCFFSTSSKKTSEVTASPLPRLSPSLLAPFLSFLKWFETRNAKSAIGRAAIRWSSSADRWGTIVRQTTHRDSAQSSIADHRTSWGESNRQPPSHFKPHTRTTAWKRERTRAHLVPQWQLILHQLHASSKTLCNGKPLVVHLTCELKTYAVKP
jgi:hypothetical protein